LRVVEFRSPAEFPEDVFESAHMLNKILQHDLRAGHLMGRRVAVRYADDKARSTAATRGAMQAGLSRKSN
jgi:hypothetical protein